MKLDFYLYWKASRQSYSATASNSEKCWPACATSIGWISAYLFQSRSTSNYQVSEASGSMMASPHACVSSNASKLLSNGHGSPCSMAQKNCQKFVHTNQSR